MLNNIFKAFKWSTEDFLTYYSRAFTLISLKVIKDKKRISNDTLICILIYSGLHRNYNLSNRNRDWRKITLATVLKTAIVDGYCETLLSKCSLANRLWRDLGTYLFLQFSRIKRLLSSIKAGSMVSSWVFADGLPIQGKTLKE